MNYKNNKDYDDIENNKNNTYHKNKNNNNNKCKDIFSVTKLITLFYCPH